MNNSKEIESIQVAAGKRTYFFDVQLTREGAKYLTITESKRQADGSYERHKVMFFEDDIADIVNAFQNALKHFPSNTANEKSKMEIMKEKYDNAYKPWTDEDDLKLTRLFCDGKKPGELSEIFKRNLGAINSRIEKLDLKNKYS